MRGSPSWAKGRLTRALNRAEGRTNSLGREDGKFHFPVVKKKSTSIDLIKNIWEAAAWDHDVTCRDQSLF